MTESLKSLINTNKDLKLQGNLLFFYKTTTTFDKRYRTFTVCFFEKSMVILDSKQILEVIPYPLLRVKKNNVEIKFKFRSKDNISKKLSIAIDNEHLLNEFYNNITEKIRVEQLKEEPLDITKSTKNKINFIDPIKKTKNKGEDKNIYINVEFSNINFFTSSKVKHGLRGVKKNVIKRLAEYFYPDKVFTLNKIDLSVFEKLKFYIKYKKNIYLLDKNEDLFSACEYLENKIDILVINKGNNSTIKFNDKII